MIQKRSQGQTAVYGDPEYGDLEWIFAPFGLQDATWRQIEELRAKGHRIRVIQWPQNEEAAEPSWLDGLTRHGTHGGRKEKNK